MLLEGDFLSLAFFPFGLLYHYLVGLFADLIRQSVKMSNHARNLILVHLWDSCPFKGVAHNDRSPLFIALLVLSLRTASRWQLIVRGLIALHLRCPIKIWLYVVQGILVVANSPLAFFILHPRCRQSSRLVLLPFFELTLLQAVNWLKDTVLLCYHDR